MSRPTLRRWRGPLIAAAVTVAVVVSVVVPVEVRHRRLESLFADLEERAAQTPRAVLVSEETVSGPLAPTTETGRAVRFGDALVRWSVARSRGDIEPEELERIAGQMVSLAQEEWRRGSAEGWLARLEDGPSPLPPEGATLRGIARSAPPGAFDAGRVLAALRLWPSSAAADLGPERRSTIRDVLDETDLLRRAPARMVELLGADSLSAGEVNELRGLATELVAS